MGKLCKRKPHCYKAALVPYSVLGNSLEMGTLFPGHLAGLGELILTERNSVAPEVTPSTEKWNSGSQIDIRFLTLSNSSQRQLSLSLVVSQSG